MDLLVGETGSRVHGVHVLHRAGGAPRFFLQFTTCAGRRVLTRFEATSRNFIEKIQRGVAVLLDQQQLRIGTARVAQERHDRARPRMTHHLQLPLGTVGKAHRVDVEIDDAPRVGAAGADLARVDAHRVSVQGFLPRQ